MSSNDETRIKVDTRPPAWAIRSLERQGDRTVYRVDHGFTIGRADDCGLVLEDSLLSRKHAEFTLRGHRLFVTDTSTNGTFVNDQRVEQAEVRVGDIIAFDELRYEVLIADESAPAPRTPRQVREITKTETQVNPRRSRPAPASDLQRVKYRDQADDGEAPIADPRDSARRAGRQERIASRQQSRAGAGRDSTGHREVAPDPRPEPKKSGNIMDELMDELPPEVPESVAEEAAEETAPARGKGPGIVERIDAVVPVRHLAIFGVLVLAVIGLVAFDQLASDGGDNVSSDQATQNWFKRLTRGNNYISPFAHDLFGGNTEEVVIATADGNLVFVDPLSGDELMSIQLPNKPATAPMTMPSQSGTNGYVVVPTVKNYLMGYDAAGGYLWSTDFGRFSKGAEHPAVPLPRDNSLALLGTKGRGVLLFELASGEILWDSRGDGFVDADTAIAVRENAGADEFFVADPKGLVTAFSIENRTPRVLWKADMNSLGNPGHLTLAGEKLLVSTTTGDLYAWDTVTGNKMWKTPLNTSVTANHIISRDRMIVFDIRGVMHNIDTATGQLLTEVDVGESIALTPHVQGETIIFKDSAGAIKAVNPDGTLITQIYVTDADSYRGRSLLLSLDGSPSLISVSQNGVLSRVDF